MSEDLADALRLWTVVDPYAGFPSCTIGWRLLPALEFGRYCLWRDGGEPVGFASWGFMTAEEFEGREYDGWEVFGREGGDRLVVVDMIAPGGGNDVVLMCRDLRRLFGRLYPEHRHVWAHRGRRDGVFPNLGG